MGTNLKVNIIRVPLERLYFVVRLTIVRGKKEQTSRAPHKWYNGTK